MINRGPIITLLAVVALAAVLLVANMTVQSQTASRRGWPAGRSAGLYQGSGTVNGAPNRIGWIVLPDGSQVGVMNKDGIREPAPGLDPQALTAVTVEGTRIEPQQVSGDTQIVGVASGPPA